MKKVFFIILLFPTLLVTPLSHAMGGKENTEPTNLRSVDSRICRSSFKTTYIGSLTPENIATYLEKNISNLTLCNSSLHFLSNVESKTGFHYLYQQTYKGTPVYRGQIKVNTDKKGNILSLFDNSYDANIISDNTFPTDAIKDSYYKSLTNVQIFNAEKNYFIEDNTSTPVWRIEVLKDVSDYYEVLINSTGTIIYTNDLSDYYRPQSIDSTVAALVYLPDPLTTAGVTYGSPYIDNTGGVGNSDCSQLTAQRVNVNMKVYYNLDTFRLKGPYAIIKDFDSPTTAPAYCKGPANFNFTRSQTGFEDVNAYYHVSTFHQYIQSLGFNNLVNYPIEIDTHALSGAENSKFVPATQRLFFGEGGVDDAEDADVIIHEYNHATSFSAAPNTNMGGQRTTLDEANCDYLAASYSRSLNSYKWDYIFNWDGHNTFWSGRSCVSTKHYPNNLVNNLYTDAEIWSSTIMEIYGDIGRQTTDEILLESMYSYANNMIMSSAAKLFLQADTTLNSGQHYSAICNRMHNRGLCPVCTSSVNEFDENTVSIINSKGFTNGGKVTIEFKMQANVSITIFDMLGKKIKEENLENINSLELNGSDFIPGFYLVNINGNSNKTIKLVRY